MHYSSEVYLGGKTRSIMHGTSHIRKLEGILEFSQPSLTSFANTASNLAYIAHPLETYDYWHEVKFWRRYPFGIATVVFTPLVPVVFLANFWR